MLVLNTFTTGDKKQSMDNACQDNLYVEQKDEMLTFAIADGAGSAKLSQYGSKLAVETLGNYLDVSLAAGQNEFSLVFGFQEARRILEIAAGNKHQIKDFHTTLCGGYFIDNMLRCAGVGDSICLVVDQNDQITLPFLPTKGEAPNQTIFLTSDQWEKCFYLSEPIENPKGLIACTDGLEHLLYSVCYQDDKWEVNVHEDVIIDVFDYISKNQENPFLWEEFKGMFAGEKANQLNNDDKGIIMVLFNC